MIKCTGATTCTNTVNSNSARTLILYTTPGHTAYSFIYCDSGVTCTNTITSAALIHIDCSTAKRCTNTLSTTTTLTSAGKKYYPYIDCSMAE